MTGETMKKYYLMTRGATGELYVYIRGNYCIAAPEWEDAREGIVTELEIVQQREDEDGVKHIAVRGKMVETEEIDWDAQDILRIKDVYPLECCTLLEKYSDFGRGFYTNIKGEGLCEVALSADQRNKCDEELRGALRFELVQRVMREYSQSSEKRQMECIIRNYAEIKIDSAESVTIYGDAIFYVFYPGAYRDFYKQFVVDKEGSIRNLSLEAVDKMLKSRRYFRWNEIMEEMDKLGIAVGEDSGDAVEGVSEEERKYLTTRRLPGGGLLVMFKAEEFSYELLENKNLTERVCCGLGKWMNRLGEENPYWGWID